MKYFVTLIFALCLLAPVSAEPASFFVKESKAFDAAVAKARSWEDLHSRLSANSLTKLKALSPELRAKGFKYLKMGTAMAAGNPMTLKESKIGAKQASITMAGKPKTSKSKGGGKSTLTMSSTVNFAKEGGKWKVDIGEHLDRLR